MNDIYVLVEHRQGKLRDISLEMLTKGLQLAEKVGGQTIAVLLGSKVDDFANQLTGYSDKVLYIDDPLFADNNSDKYQKVLVELIKERKPYLIMIGNTNQGVDLAPALAVELEIPFIMDVTGVEFINGKLQMLRQFYQGKVNAEYNFRGEPPYLFTFREATQVVPNAFKAGTIEKVQSPLNEDTNYRKFLEYIEAKAGDIDITQSEILVGVGRGLKEEKNMSLIEDLAKAINADICGSRAAVDMGWLPYDRQVGTTGKTVRPKLYIAIGISGACQHLAALKGARNIIAINKDPNAPIFNVADYAIVDDMFKVVPKLTEKLKELRG